MVLFVNYNYCAFFIDLSACIIMMFSLFANVEIEFCSGEFRLRLIAECLHILVVFS